MTAIKDTLYATDISDATWHRIPGQDEAEVAYFGDGNIALRNVSTPDVPPLRYTSKEWDAFVKGAAEGQFDLR